MGSVFFFNDTATTEIYTLSLHDALPISAVWLSKGRMATVLMLGSPPPAKPYRHPLSARASVLTAPAPNRGIEHRRRVHHDHRKLKTSPLPREIHAGARRHPLGVEIGRASCRERV